MQFIHWAQVLSKLKRRRALVNFGIRNVLSTRRQPQMKFSWHCLWSFLIGYKLEAFAHYGDLVADPQKVILSSRGLVVGCFCSRRTGFTRS